MEVLFYTKQDCPLCDDVKAQVWVLQQEYAFEMEERDILTHDAWFNAYQFSVPVVEINGKQLNGESISYMALEEMVKGNI